jgi:hypothetical protein
MDQFTVFVPADPVAIGDAMTREELADETLHEYGGVRLSDWQWQLASKAELLTYGYSDAEATLGYFRGSDQQVMRGRCYAERATDSH